MTYTVETHKIHEKLLGLIKIFDEICVKNNIWYTLTSGSVLGAIRHKGFIPWDRDMDVFVRVDDINKLRKALVQALPKEMVLHIWDSKSDYHMCFDRLSYAETSHDLVHLDVFPLIGAPNNVFSRKIFTNVCFFTYKFFRCKHVDIMYSKESTVRIVKLLKCFAKLFPDRLIQAWYHFLERLYPLQNAKYVYTIASGYGFKECLPKELVLSTKRVEFENIELPVPLKYHEYLTAVYGDYMTPKREGYKKT